MRGDEGGPSSRSRAGGAWSVVWLAPARVTLPQTRGFGSGRELLTVVRNPNPLPPASTLVRAEPHDHHAHQVWGVTARAALHALKNNCTTEHKEDADA